MMRTVRYGQSDSQSGDLHLPAKGEPAVVCLLHGGFWKMPYGRDQMTALADDLAARDYAVWNIGYRRVGEPGGGWPGTMQDAVDAIEYLAVLADEVATLDLRRVAVVGHSAGGQLALHAVACSRMRRVHPIAVASLSGVVDLRRAFALGCGGGAVSALLGDGPETYPERYAQASPSESLPLGVRQLLIHGDSDEALPVAISRAYVHAAREAGDSVDYIEMPGMGHMDYLDPANRVHSLLSDWLSAVSRTP